MMQENDVKILCQYCGAEIPKTAAFCPRCGRKPAPVEDETLADTLPLSPPGEPVQAALCSFCGSTLIPETLFCWNCGKPSNGADPAAAAPTEFNSAHRLEEAPAFAAAPAYGAAAAYAAGPTYGDTLPSAPAPAVPVYQPAPAAQPPPPYTPPASAEVKVSSTWRYPFLKIFQFLLRFFGGLIVLSGAGFIIATLAGSAFLLNRLNDSLINSGLLYAGGNLLVILGTVISVFILSFPFFASAEFIQMFMNIEGNQRIQIALLQRRS